MNFSEVKRLWIAAYRAAEAANGSPSIQGAVDEFIKQIECAISYDESAKRHIELQAEGLEQVMRQGNPEMEVVS